MFSLLFATSAGTGLTSDRCLYGLFGDRSAQTPRRDRHRVTSTHPAMPTPYERQRAENLKKNKALLQELGLDELKMYVPPKTAKKDIAPTAKSRKRKSPPPQDEKGENGSNAKALKTRAAEDITNASGMRRSARNAGKVVDYKSETVKTLPEVISHAAKIAENAGGKRSLERLHTPYVDLSVATQPLTLLCNVGNSTVTFLRLRLVVGGRRGVLHPDPRRSRVDHILHREACSADAIHA